jgi:carboxylesterase type B
VLSLFRVASVPAAELTPMKVGISEAVNTVLAIWMAEEAGFYAANGLKIEIINMNGGSRGAAELAAVVSGTWAAFARTGSPENGALPDWPAYTPDGRATMILDSECRLVIDPDRDARLLWERIAIRG